MISKPLFLQSLKANGLAWGLVTVATAFMLAILIVVLGNLQTSEIRDSLKDTFIESEIEKVIKLGAIEGYEETYQVIVEVYPNVKEVYDDITRLIDTYNQIVKFFPNPIDVIIKGIQEDPNMTEEEKEQAVAVARMVLTAYEEQDIPDERIHEFKSGIVIEIILNNMDKELKEEEKEALIAISSQVLSLYDEKGELDEEDFHHVAFLYVNTSLYNSLIHTETEELAELGYFTMKELFDDYGFTEIRVNILVSTGLSHYLSLLEHDVSKEEAKAEVTKSLLSQMPKDVSESLVELGDLDINHLVIGKVFYQIAGLLLPIVYTILTANNLIAGQVDSGAMAYVLSTPTKRKKVTFTQMTYLVVSLITMFIVIGGVGFIAKLFTDDSFTISNKQFILLNVGSFISMLAISGICFLASAWFNRSKHSLGLGGGISMFFLVAIILGMFGSESIPAAMRIESMNLFNYMTIISLFDVTAILEGGTYLYGLLILLGIAVLTYAAGILIFDRKDLPL